MREHDAAAAAAAAAAVASYRGKVPTESREESKRRPCPLQTSSSFFSFCFSRSSYSFLFFPALSLFLPPIELSAGSFDWCAREREGKKVWKKERDRVGERRNGTSA